MTTLDLQDVKSFLCDEYYLGEGSEVICYSYNDEIIKIFKTPRKSPFKLMSSEGLIKLSTLPLKYFNKPISFITHNGVIIGFTEKKIIEEEINLESIDYEGIKEDIITLSNNGFKINDLYYNYIYSNGTFYFIDLTSYQYIDIKNDYLKGFFYKENIKEINIFLIGINKFKAFLPGNQGYEFTKIYLANEERIKELGNEYYGDVLKDTLKG